MHKTSALLGYHIVAADGEIGHVDDFLIDSSGRTVQYLVVDTSNWVGGKSVLLSAATIDNIDSPNRKIQVSLTREAIKNGPSIETADIDPIETLPAVWIM